jgi:flagellar biosynthesis GTPase FlhF
MREEEKRRKDEEKKKKEEDKEKLRLEREEEKRRKEEERKKKEEEKRKKDDERKKKEEDKRRKEEERERAEEDKKRQAEKKRAYWGQFKAATASGEGTAPHRLQTSREIAAPSTSVRSWSTELFRAWQPAVSAVIAPLHRWQARDLSSFEQQLAAQNGKCCDGVTYHSLTDALFRQFKCQLPPSPSHHVPRVDPSSPHERRAEWRTTSR